MTTTCRLSFQDYLRILCVALTTHLNMAGSKWCTVLRDLRKKNKMSSLLEVTREQSSGIFFFNDYEIDDFSLSGRRNSAFSCKVFYPSLCGLHAEFALKSRFMIPIKINKTGFLTFCQLTKQIYNKNYFWFEAASLISFAILNKYGRGMIKYSDYQYFFMSKVNTFIE